MLQAVRERQSHVATKGFYWSIQPRESSIECVSILFHGYRCDVFMDPWYRVTGRPQILSCIWTRETFWEKKEDRSSRSILITLTLLLFLPSRIKDTCSSSLIWLSEVHSSWNVASVIVEHDWLMVVTVDEVDASNEINKVRYFRKGKRVPISWVKVRFDRTTFPVWKRTTDRKFDRSRRRSGVSIQFR